MTNNEKIKKLIDRLSDPSIGELQHADDKPKNNQPPMGLYIDHIIMHHHMELITQMNPKKWTILSIPSSKDDKS